MVAADDNRAGAGVGNRADPRLDGVVAFLDADRRRVDVADVGNVQAIEWGDLLEVAVTADQRRLAANLARAQPRAGPVRGAAVVRHADNGDVEPARILDMRQPHERRRLGEPRRREGSAWLVCHGAILRLITKARRYTTTRCFLLQTFLRGLRTLRVFVRTRRG